MNLAVGEGALQPPQSVAPAGFVIVPPARCASASTSSTHARERTFQAKDGPRKPPLSGSTPTSAAFSSHAKRLATDVV